MIERAVMLLPEPDSPTMPRVSPRWRSKSTPSTRAHDPALGVQLGPQVTHREDYVLFDEPPSSFRLDGVYPTVGPKPGIASIRFTGGRIEGP